MDVDGGHGEHGRQEGQQGQGGQVFAWGTVDFKVSQSNKLSLDPAYHLPNYVVNIFKLYLEKKLKFRSLFQRSCYFTIYNGNWRNERKNMKLCF